MRRAPTEWAPQSSDQRGKKNLVEHSTAETDPHGNSIEVPLALTEHSSKRPSIEYHLISPHPNYLTSSWIRKCSKISFW